MKATYRDKESGATFSVEFPKGHVLSSQLSAELVETPKEKE